MAPLHCTFLPVISLSSMPNSFVTSLCSPRMRQPHSRVHLQPRPCSTILAVLDSSSTDSLSSTEEATRLRQEHLNAYFEGNESTYQTSLSSVFRLGFQNFAVELGELQTSFRRLIGLEPPLQYTPPDCLNFKLNDEAVARRERKRALEHSVDAGPFVRFVYTFSCKILDLKYEGHPIPRFWVLETVARMPYFAYSSCLHLLATLGWFRSPTLMNMHHAEELNEAYHLAVMESLGGDKRWEDRFFAFHISIIYYWVLVVLFCVAPAEAYRFSQLIETHAVDTYIEFLEENEELLRSLPAPDVAHEYYANFMYYFYEFQLSAGKELDEHTRRPQINSLLDVFQNILLDEIEHSKTMVACTNYIENDDPIWYNGKCVSGSARRPNVIPTEQRQDFWQKWTRLQEPEQPE